MEHIFDIEVSRKIVMRINQLTADAQPQWGKMNVAQMLAHCCVTYETVYTDKHSEPNAFVKLILKLFVKKIVTNEVPYKKNGQTAPHFLISDQREFEKERERLIDYVERAQKDGAAFYENRTSHSFGVLSLQEWSNLFYKHLDHHLTQFGV